MYANVTREEEEDVYETSEIPARIEIPGRVPWGFFLRRPLANLGVRRLP